MLPLIAAAVAGVSWLAGVVGYIGALRNPSGRRTTSEMFFNGFQIYVAANFNETGLKWRSVYFAGVTGFVTSLAAICVTADP
jgi:hypothetical protein